MAAPTQKVINTENLRSVVSGGTLPGWTPESAVVLWRRMLGSLGDINKIDDPENYAQVLEYLCDLTDVLIKVTNPLVPSFADAVYTILQTFLKFKRKM